MKKFVTMAFLSASLLLAACGDKAADKVDAALAEKFNTHLCMTEPKRFPHAVTGQPPAWLQPLVDAGLLHMEKRTGQYRSHTEYVYTMTEKALKYTTEQGFLCYGKQEYLRVEGLNEPEGGFKPGQQFPVKVVVNRTVKESWAKADALKSKIKSGEFTYPAVVMFRNDGTIHVLK